MTKRLTRAGLAECVRHLEAARAYRSKVAALTKDRDVRAAALGSTAGLTVAIDHLRAEWGLK